MERRSSPALRWVLVYKGVFVVCALCSAIFLDDYQRAYHEGFNEIYHAPWPRAEAITFASRFATWGAAPYLTIARNGYTPGSPLCAYYPLLPALIAPVARCISAPAAFLWGLLLVNSLSVVGVLQLYRYFLEQSDHATARLATLLFLMFPGAIFLSFIYTESLFLVLSLIALRALHSGKNVAFAMAAFLMPLTKAIGVFVLIPAVYHFAITGRKRGWWIMVFPLLGWVAYLGVMFYFTGDPFEGLKAQRFFANSASIENIFNVGEFLSSALSWNQSLFDPAGGVLDRLTFVAFITGVACSYRFSKEELYYVIAIGMIPAMSHHFVSYTRYVTVCFPVFLGFGNVLRTINKAWLTIVIMSYFSVLQFYCLIRHVNFKWVS